MDKGTTTCAKGEPEVVLILWKSTASAPKRARTDSTDGRVGKYSNAGYFFPFGGEVWERHYYIFIRYE